MSALDLIKDEPVGRLAALVHKIGGPEVMDAILCGEKVVIVQNKKEAVIEEAVLKLFDKNGRRIPPRGLQAAVCDPNRSFHLIRPEIDYETRLERFEGTGLEPRISAADFEARARELLQTLDGSEPLKNLLKGVPLPVVIPQAKVADLGRTTEEFVVAAGKAYCRQFPERSFINYNAGELEGQVSIVAGSRYERLVEAMAKASIVVIYFSNPLQGFSALAQREQMATLPEGFILSGTLDTAAAWVMYPDVLARDYQTPGYDCSAVFWQSSGGSLCFGAGGDRAYFGGRACLSDARGDYSGGLLFVG